MKRIDLSRLQGRFQHLVGRYMAQHDINQTELARLVGMQRSHVSALLTRNPNAQRKLTAYYLYQFIRRGIMTKKDVYDGQPETDREEEFWGTASEMENLALLKRIARLRKKGIDVEKILSAMDDE